MVLNVSAYGETEIVFRLSIWKGNYVVVVAGPEAKSKNRTIPLRDR